MPPFDLEESNGKPRITRGRRSDVLNGASTAEPPRPQRNAKGQWETGNKGATGRGWKHALVQTLPDAPEAGTLYRCAVRELDHDTPGARASCARWVRATLREADLDREAVKVGVGTEIGMKLLDLARQYGVEADRAMTAALTYTKRKTPTKSASPAPKTKTAELREQVMGGPAR